MVPLQKEDQMVPFAGEGGTYLPFNSTIADNQPLFHDMVSLKSHASLVYCIHSIHSIGDHGH
jgi:hypothetical protein